MDTMSARLASTTEAPSAPASRERIGHTVRTPDVRIDGWLVQPMLNALTRNEITVRLRPQLMDLLLCLASNPGNVMLKDELQAVVWDGRWIAESGLSRCIAELRSALGDNARQPRIIQTITKRGYRLIAPVERLPASHVTSIPAAPPARRDPEAPAAEAESAWRPRSLWQRLESAARILVARVRS